MPVDEDADELFALLDDECARAILVATSVEPLSAVASRWQTGVTPSSRRFIDVSTDWRRSTSSRATSS